MTGQKRVLGWVASVLMLTCSSVCGSAQEVERLFDYPIAPDTCSTLEERCNYIITHFWDSYDISRPITEPLRFEMTFRDYVDFFKYAHRNVVVASVRQLLYKAQANTHNFELLGEVAQRTLYGPEAEFWSDELYTVFAKALAANHNLPKEQREYYAHQLQVINATQPGTAIDFECWDASGNKKRLSDYPAQGYIVFMGGDGTNSSIARLRMSTDINLNQIIEQGQVVVVNVWVGKNDNAWRSAAASMPNNWVNVCSERAAQDWDIRFVPSCLILDGERKLLNKNISIEHLKEALTQ